MAFFEETKEDGVHNGLWTEKYRPNKLSEYVGNDHLKEKVQQFFLKAGTRWVVYKE